MTGGGWRAPAIAALVLLLSGTVGAAGTIRISRQYVQTARTLSLFEVSVEVAAVSPGLELSLSYHNPGPWPVKLLEVQVLAWHKEEYLGAASRDLRGNPVVVPPASTSRLTLSFPPGRKPAPPQAAGQPKAAWRFSLAGRLEVPVLGTRTFSREIVYPQPDGASWRDEGSRGEE